MAAFEGIGKVLIIAGLLLVFGGRIPFLGRLPGDIIIRRDGFSFYFPLVTFLIISVIVTIIINLVLRLTGK